MDYTTDACPGTLLTGTGTSVITSGFCNVVAISFIGTGTGGVQLFAGVTTSVSLTPMITFSATSSAVAGGFSPMTLRFPLAVSGTGLTVKMLGSTDPNIMLFWSPAGAP
jgi:hypothetical protein